MSVRKKKPRRGRPPGPPENRRRRVMSFRVTDAELGVYMGAAESLGEELGDWARRVLTAEAMRPFGGGK